MRDRPKMKSKIEIWRNNANMGHTAIVYFKKGHKYLYISLTHSKRVNGVSTLPLDKNPNPLDGSVAYFIPTPLTEHKREFRIKLEDWKISKSDLKKLKPYMKTK